MNWDNIFWNQDPQFCCLLWRNHLYLLYYYYIFPDRHTIDTGVRIASLLHKQSLSQVQGSRVPGSSISFSLISNNCRNNTESSFCFLVFAPNMSLQFTFSFEISEVSNSCSTLEHSRRCCWESICNYRLQLISVFGYIRMIF